MALQGAGTELDPYIVSQETDFTDLLVLPTGLYYVEQANDLDFSGITGITQSVAGLGYDYEGNGHTIANLTFDGNAGTTGLNPMPPADAVWKDVNFVNMTAENCSGRRSGLLAGFTNGDRTFVERVHLQGTMNFVYSSTLAANVGGLWGRSQSNENQIRDCFIDVQINADLSSTTADVEIGGVMGRMEQFSIMAHVVSISTINVTGAGTQTVTESGIFGSFLVNRSVSEAFWDSEFTGITSDPHPATTGLTTSQAKDITTYSGTTFDIVNKSSHDGNKTTATWFIDDGVDYPQLWFNYEQAAPPEPTSNTKVKIGGVFTSIQPQAKINGTFQNIN